MMAPENSHYMEPEKNSIPSKNSRCFDFCFPKRFCHCCCSIQVGLIQSQVFFLLCGIFSIVIGYLHTANMVMGSIMIVLAVMALFATVWKSRILAPIGITIAVIGIVNTVSTTNLSLKLGQYSREVILIDQIHPMFHCNRFHQTSEFYFRLQVDTKIYSDLTKVKGIFDQQI